MTQDNIPDPTRIALFLSHLEGRYASSIWLAASVACAERGWQLMVFPGHPLHSPVGEESRHNMVYKLSDGRFFDGILYVTGLLGNYTGASGLNELLADFKDTPAVSITHGPAGHPSVYIDNYAAMAKVMSHLFDDHGFRRVAYISGPESNDEARERLNAYLDAVERTEGAQALVYHGDTFDRDTGIMGVRHVLEHAGDPMPEAIACCTDFIAYGAHQALSERGLTVPEDLALTGFDDTEQIRYHRPPFTSVNQELFHKTMRAVEVLAEGMAGREMPAATLTHASLVIRRSCGCPRIPDHGSADPSAPVGTREQLAALMRPVLQRFIAAYPRELFGGRAAEDAFADVIAKELRNGDQGGNTQELTGLLDYLAERYELYKPDMARLETALLVLRRYLQPVLERHRELYAPAFENALAAIGEYIQSIQAMWRLRHEETIRRLGRFSQSMDALFDMGELFDQLETALPRLGIARAFISLYQKDAEDEIRAWAQSVPGNLRLVFAMHGYRRRELKRNPYFYPRHTILPEEYLPEMSMKPMVVLPLFSHDEHFGIAILDLKPELEMSYEQIRERISSHLLSIRLARQRASAEERLTITLEDLRKSNARLRELSLRDEMTTLYNRRGLFEIGSRQIAVAARQNASVLLLYIDLDNLKHINDQLGHSEGDSAIVATAEVLRASFRSSDLLARIGGDEFVVLAVGPRADRAAELKQHLVNQIAGFNRESRMRYTLSLSIGAAHADAEDNADLTGLLRRADIELYRNKELKRSGRDSTA